MEFLDSTGAQVVGYVYLVLWGEIFMIYFDKYLLLSIMYSLFGAAMITAIIFIGHKIIREKFYKFPFIAACVLTILTLPLYYFFQSQAKIPVDVLEKIEQINWNEQDFMKDHGYFLFEEDHLLEKEIVGDKTSGKGEGYCVIRITEKRDAHEGEDTEKTLQELGYKNFGKMNYVESTSKTKFYKFFEKIIPKSMMKQDDYRYTFVFKDYEIIVHEISNSKTSLFAQEVLSLSEALKES